MLYVKQRYLPILALTVSGLAVSQNVIAQKAEENSSFTLNKVLVSATRTESKVSDSSRSVSVVGKDQLETFQSQSVAQAVKSEPNITITGGPRSGSQSVNIRGLEGSKVLQVVDGVRQVFQSGHRPSYFIDPEMLKSIEVVKGPASTLWGSGAIGGVVAQNTISAGNLLDADQDFGGYVKASFNSNNDKQTYVGALAGRSGALDTLVNYYYRDSNDLKQGNSENLENSGKRDNGFLVKSEWQVDDSQALKLTYRQSTGAGAIPSNGTVELSTSVFLIDRDTDTQNAVIDYELNTDSDLVNAGINVYWNYVEMAESRVSDGRGDSTELEVYGLSLKNTSQLDSVILFYGIDGYSEKFVADRSGDNRPTPPEAISDVWGAYLSANIDVRDDLKFEVGARYDSFETKAENLGSKTDDSDVSPSVAFIWQATDAVQLTARHEQAFRAPSSEELYTTGTHFCMGPGFCNTFLSNPDLKPEKAANTELMARIEFEPNEQGGRLYVESALFENKVDDFIEHSLEGMTFYPVMNAGITTWRNVDKATIRGFEFASTYVQNAFTLKFSYGRTHGQNDKTQAYLSQIPAAKKVFDASYAWLNDSLTTGMRVTDVSTQQHVNDGIPDEGYTLADVYASWAPAALDGVKFDLAVNNLTDRFYRQAWQELYEPGREIILSSKLSF